MNVQQAKEFRARLRRLQTAILRPGERSARIFVSRKSGNNAAFWPVGNIITVRAQLAAADDELLIGLLAHELGHRDDALNRVMRAIFVAVLLAPVFAYLAVAKIHMSEIAVVPWLVALIATFALALGSLNRRIEAGADACAIRRIGAERYAAADAAFKRLDLTA